MPHETFMRRCLDLALNGAGNTAPNPMVGAVLVYNDVTIGEGFHTAHGQPHAEVEAIRSVRDIDKHLIAASTLYVNLEPCSHHGKTPPCADLILEHNIRNVVVGAGDPNPLVNGKGIQKLRDAGVNVTESVLRDECTELNKRFYTFHQLQRPYIILKWAQSADGFISGGSTLQRTQISNPLSQVLVHKWRTEEAAILVGYNTALTDNPQLTARHWKGKNPLRFVYDPELSLPRTLNLFVDGNETWIINHQKENVESSVRYKKVEKENWLPQTLQLLYESKLTSLLVEGGTKTLETFIHQGVWDEARVFTAPVHLRNGVRAPALPAYENISEVTMGDNTLTVYTR